MKAFLARHKTVLILFFVAFVSRLVVWPWAQNTEADAASRILLSEDLLGNLRVISSGHWPSLHFYFNALFIWIFQDRILGPTFLSILLGSISIIPFYLFTRNVFNHRGAFFAALVFTFSGVIFRHSFHALAEIYHVCFSLFTLYFISEVSRNKEKKYRYAILAGLTATIATGGRFEAWILVGLLGIILLLQKESKAFFIYGMVAALFPVFWLIGNYVAFQDPLYSLHSVEHFNYDIGGVNDNIDKTEIFRRLIFFPFSWMIAVTPIIALIIAGIVLRRSIKRLFTREQVYYLLLGLLFFVIFIVKCYNGSLVVAHRFTVTLVFVSLPFFALWFDRERKLQAKKIATIIIVATMIPFSFYWQHIPFGKIGWFNKRMGNVMDAIVYFTYPQTQAVPRLTNQAAAHVVDAVNAKLTEGEASVVDFSDWEATYYMGLELHIPRWDGFVISGGAHYMVPYYEVEMFLQQRPKGKLIISDWSQFENGTHLHGNVMDHDSLLGSFVLSPLYSEGHLRAFDYVYVVGEERDRLRAENLNKPPLYRKEKDILYYETMIRSEQNWYMRTIEQAREGDRDVEGMVRENAQWMIDNTPHENNNDTIQVQ